MKKPIKASVLSFMILCAVVASFVFSTIFSAPSYAQSETTESETSCVPEGIGWIVCPATQFMANVADRAFDFLEENFLEFKSETLNIDGDLFKAWSQVLVFANAGLVIFFLIIIFSQISGVGISNYGIKKMLPRLIVTAILMNLSFFIVQLAADISNILGYNLKLFFENLATGPSTASEQDRFSQVTGTILSGAAVGGAAVGVGILAAGAGGISGLFVVLIPILLGAVIALLMIFLILIVRQVLLILLTVAAPIAFLAYLLPNTESWFKRWYKTLISLLMVFPVIGLISGLSSFASGIIADSFNPPDPANPSQSNASNPDPFTLLISQAVLVLPLFLVPSFLKKSLDSVQAVSGKLNSMGQKVEANATGKAKKGMENSIVGQRAAYNREQAELRKKQIQAGTFAGGRGVMNSVRGRMSAIYGGINRRSGQFGASMTASGIRATNEERARRDEEADQIVSTLDDEARMNIAHTGEHAGRRYDLTTRRAALRHMASNADYGTAQELISRSHYSGDVHGGDLRAELGRSLRSNSTLRETTPYMDEGFLRHIESNDANNMVIERGTDNNGEVILTRSVSRAINEAAGRGSVNAASLASASPEAINTLHQNLTGTDRDIVRGEITRAYGDPNLSPRIAGRRRASLDTLRNNPTPPP